MKKEIRTRAPDALVSTDAKTGKRIPIIPTPVSGFWHQKRTQVQMILLGLYFVLPFLRINGQKIIFFDIFHREFHFLTQVFHAHDMPALVFFTLSFFFFMGLITLLFGRAWCGWACPQTVFIEQVYRRIEIWILGDPAQRLAFYEAPFEGKNQTKLISIFLSYLIVSILIGASFLSYFVSPLDWPEHPVLLALSIIIPLFVFGWFKEQFCFIACPYGRFQSVLQDSRSLNVTYQDEQNLCIDCKKCVKVCPSGIDIRMGLQQECIACTSCIDACDSVFQRILKNGLAKGLIQYQIQEKKSFNLNDLVRTRGIIYLSLFLMCIGTLTYKIYFRPTLIAQSVRGSGAPYLIQEDREKVLNQFTLRLYSNSEKEQKIKISINSEMLELIIPQKEITLKANEKLSIPLFLSINFHQASLKPRRLEVQLKIENLTFNNQSKELTLQFYIPDQIPKLKAHALVMPHHE